MSSDSECLTDREEEESASLIRNRTMEAHAEHQRIRRYNTGYVVLTILGVTLVVLTFIWVDTFLGGFSLEKPKIEFNWHPVFMITGMVFLYSQSMLVYRTGRNQPKYKLKLIHAGLHISIAVLVALALKAVFDSHNYASPQIPNLYSFHAWLGILTVGLFCCQLVIGFASFLYPGASKGFRQAVLPYHVVIGTSCFVMAIVTSALGFMEEVMFLLGKTYSTRPFAGTLLNIIGLILVIFGILAIHLVSDPSYKRVENEEEVPLSE